MPENNESHLVHRIFLSSNLNAAQEQIALLQHYNTPISIAETIGVCINAIIFSTSENMLIVGSVVTIMVASLIARFTVYRGLDPYSTYHEEISIRVKRAIIFTAIIGCGWTLFALFFFQAGNNAFIITTDALIGISVASLTFASVALMVFVYVTPLAIALTIMMVLTPDISYKLMAGGFFFVALPCVYLGVMGINKRIISGVILLEENKQMALYDHLTNLPNRRLFAEASERSLKISRRGDKKVGIIFVDLDEFKNINDTFGHEAGDLVLVETANRLKANIRETDLAARIGGDEFCILLEDIGTPKKFESIAEKIIGQLTQDVEINGRLISIQASYGCAYYPEHGESIKALLSNADSRMYRFKDRQS